MQLIRLIYASVARPELKYDDLSDILRTASRRNAENGISGILCYSGGAFLQALEGKRPLVNALYNRIANDRRHRNAEILVCEPIDVRTFIEWSMKMVRWDDSHSVHRRALVLRHSGSDVFEPWTMSARQAHGFLKDLAAMERIEELRIFDRLPHDDAALRDDPPPRSAAARRRRSIPPTHSQSA